MSRNGEQPPASRKKKNAKKPVRSSLGKLLRRAGQHAANNDSAATETLWLAFNGLARQLAALVDKQQSAFDHGRIADVLVRCQHMLNVVLARRDAAALRIAEPMTTHGCELLQQTTARDREFVASYAEKAAFWPVMMARKRMYHEAADEYLGSIRVGTKSVPPTLPDTSIEATGPCAPCLVPTQEPFRWTDLAIMLATNIALYRTILLRNEAGVEWSGPVMQRAEQEICIGEAKDFREVLDLPSERDGTLSLNRDTKTKWWKIAKRMLKAYWRKNPQQAQKDFARVRAVQSESEEAYATRCVRKAFYALAG